jgi:hypothetical protein
MSRIKMLCAALFSMFALAAAIGATQAAATEFVLPDAHTLSDAGYPVPEEGTLENGGAIVAELETAIGEKLTATSVTVKGTLTKLSGLGPATLRFTGVTEPKSKTLCKSTNVTTKGEVLFEGEYHMVTNAALTQHGLVFLFTELTVECNEGKLKIKIKAPAELKLEGAEDMVDITSYGLVANCTAKGKQELTEYVNDAGTVVTKANLTANFGLGAEAACERTTKELVIKTSEMIRPLW